MEEPALAPDRVAEFRQLSFRKTVLNFLARRDAKGYVYHETHSYRLANAIGLGIMVIGALMQLISPYTLIAPLVILALGFREDSSNPIPTKVMIIVVTAIVAMQNQNIGLCMMLAHLPLVTRTPKVLGIYVTNYVAAIVTGNWSALIFAIIFGIIISHKRDTLELLYKDLINFVEGDDYPITKRQARLRLDGIMKMNAGIAYDNVCEFQQGLLRYATGYDDRLIYDMFRPRIENMNRITYVEMVGNLIQSFVIGFGFVNHAMRSGFQLSEVRREGTEEDTISSIPDPRPAIQNQPSTSTNQPRKEESSDIIKDLPSLFSSKGGNYSISDVHLAKAGDAVYKKACEVWETNASPISKMLKDGHEMKAFNDISTAWSRVQEMARAIFHDGFPDLTSELYSNFMNIERGWNYLFTEIQDDKLLDRSALLVYALMIGSIQDMITICSMARVDSKKSSFMIVKGGTLKSTIAPARASLTFEIAAGQPSERKRARALIKDIGIYIDIMADAVSSTGLIEALEKFDDIDMMMAKAAAQEIDPSTYSITYDRINTIQSLVRGSAAGDMHKLREGYLSVVDAF